MVQIFKIQNSEPWESWRKISSITYNFEVFVSKTSLKVPEILRIWVEKIFREFSHSKKKVTRGRVLSLKILLLEV